MIANLVLLLAPHSMAAETLPFAWGRAESVEVRVVDEHSELVVTLGLMREANGAGVVIERTALVPLWLSGRDLETESDELTTVEAEIVAFARFAPSARVAADGSFVEWIGTEAAQGALVASLAATSGVSARMARQMTAVPAFRSLWIAPRRAELCVWADDWAGIPIEPGSYRRDGTWAAGANAEEPIPVVYTFEVAAPVVEDGRRVVHVVRTAEVDREGLGTASGTFLTGISALPAKNQYVRSFRSTFRTAATFDAETWLPLAMTATTTTEVRMESPRSTWRDTYTSETGYAFSFTLRAADQSEDPTRQ
jgi:hypothetical protein